MDEALRRLERAWRASGQEQDRVRWVLARLRQGEREEDLPLDEQAALLRARLAAGELSASRLAVAAHCGCDEAAAALGRTVERWEFPADDVVWQAGLEDLGGEDLFRQVVLILSGVGLAQVEGSYLDDAVPEALAEALEAWAEDPAPEQLRAVMDAHRYVDSLRVDLPIGSAEFKALESLEGLIAAASLNRWEDLWAGFQALSDGAGRIGELLQIALIPWALTPYTPVPDPAWVRDYAPSKRFELGDRIRHSRFGEGQVTRALTRQIEVAFETGNKKLAHGQ